MEFAHMFSPISFGPISIKNRFVVPPMGNNFANPDGTWSEQSIAYYRERAKGEYGLITIEATVAHDNAKGGPLKPCLFSDASVPSLTKIADACHAYGGKVAVQLQNAGPEGNAACAGAPLQAASAIAAADGRDVPQALSVEQIYDLVKGYGDAAERALKAGVDALEIHMAHGYLVSSFISPRTNKRVDEFGGPFENRMRFPRLILEEVRARVGSRMAVGCRINSSDEMPGGIDVHDAAIIARYLEARGADYLHVSRAVHIKDEFMWAPTSVHAGFSADLVTEIKRAVHIPVITVGRFTDAYYAELLVEQGRSDLVAFGRQSLADPYMPLKIKEHRQEDIVPCIACLQGCVANMYCGKPIRCLANPELGFEHDASDGGYRDHAADGGDQEHTAKRVVVVGGGVGGLCASAVAAERGHEVVLLEEQSQPGGNMRLAAFPPGKGDITALVRSYIVRAEKAGADIRCNTKSSLENILACEPDVVVVATGAKPFILPVKGTDEKKFALGEEILSGAVNPGHAVLVIGGGMVGCEIGDFLAELGHEVSIVEYRDVLAGDMISEHRKEIMKHFSEYGVKSHCQANVQELFEDGVAYCTPDGIRHELHGFDTVIMAVGYRSCDELSEELRAQGIETYTIGDAVRARRAIDATREAYDVARGL
ncbi:MAG: FAD-dependent oxidoreductase [Eggerthellaceae bacterium]